MVQTHLNVIVHFVYLHVNIIFSKNLSFIICVHYVHFIIKHFVNTNKRKLFTF